jgi:isoleucyl-tRNA synthetase
VAESYRKIRNSLFRYVLSNLHDFDPQRNLLPFDQMEAIDQYMLGQTVAMSADVTHWYDEFAFHKIYHRINDFCVVELSAFYFDVLKDRLYTYAPNSRGRRAAQTAIWRIGEALVRLLAPIMSFTCDEVWQYLPALPDRLPSVHLAKFPTASDILGGAVLGGSVPVQDARQSEDWKILLVVRTEVLKALEEARQSKLIGGANLEAQVAVTAAEPAFSVLARYQDQLRYLFIVSVVALEPGGSGNGTGGVSVRVSKADGKKCERCWNYSIHVGEDAIYPTVCERCSAVLKELGG